MATINSSKNDKHIMPVELLHHGAAAASTNHAVVWFQDGDGDSSCLVYASHCILNVARRVTIVVGPEERSEQVWRIKETLRSNVEGSLTTCIAKIGSQGLICGFANGSISLWWRKTGEWKEHLLVTDNRKRSLTVVDALLLAPDRLLVVSGSSAGALAYICHFQDDNRSIQADQSVTILHTPVSSVHLVDYTTATNESSFGQVLIIVGTASHRHNKIHVWQHSKDADTPQASPAYSGSLLGHEDWISCLCWKEESPTLSVLASGSQDNKIRLWKFVNRNTETDAAKQISMGQETVPHLANFDADDDEDAEDNALLELEADEGESRLEIAGSKSTTSVFLEALLVGHEAAVTSVEWHPHPQAIYGHEMVLISSSMDRSILFWAPSVGGIWTPLTRVGSAGGILGGSVGSSLLGYCRAVLEPHRGRCLIGHAYGGALHVWSLSNSTDDLTSQTTVEDRASLVNWIATPCITGHFAGVTDLCWEASKGQYLLTVSNDQTCRLWAPTRSQTDKDDSVWLELGRPQVHGYDLTAIASVSTPQHPHRIVSGADEKEIRVFDAPLATLRLLTGVSKGDALKGDAIGRVERAFIPSLGLTNKATAADGAEEDIDEDTVHPTTVGSRIPLERDLGSESIWPEIQKLYGHNAELYCLTSTCEARTAGQLDSVSQTETTLVASSTKARDAQSASIRLWDMTTSKCLQVLKDGHKSTVATMSFSPDGQFLISSGKDRRLCLWRRDAASGEFVLAWAMDTAHKRIIWAVHVCPFDGTLFASGSRDGSIRLWQIYADDSSTDVVNLCNFAPHCQVNGKPDAVTVLSFAPCLLDNGASSVLALGLESGRIELWRVAIDKEAKTATSTIYYDFPPAFCHSARVSKLAWKPCPDGGMTTKHILASCSLDHGCRLFSVDLTA